MICVRRERHIVSKNPASTGGVEVHQNPSLLPNTRRKTNILCYEEKHVFYLYLFAFIPAGISCCCNNDLTGGQHYLCDVVHSFLLQQPLVKPLRLIRGHVGLVSGEEANLVCVEPLAMGQGTAERRTFQYK